MTYDEQYTNQIEDMVKQARDFAREAKQKRGDPKPEIEIPIAEDMAERCEKLLEREYGDKIHGLAELIRDLEDNEDVDGREEMSIYLAEEFAVGELSEDFDNNAERVEAAIRTSVSILTEGVVAAPIEGIGKVEINDNDDGTEFIRIPYFGPIRSAGGTAQAVSVLVADYVRDLLNIDVFKPREEEIERYVEEIYLYDNAVGMQYVPPKDKLRYIIEHLPIMVDGQPNSQAVSSQVDGYRDLERIEGNHPRDGMCLVVSEGIGLKAPKLQRYATAFGLQSWNWLDKLTDDKDDDDSEDETEENNNNDSNDKQYTVPLRSDEVETLKPSDKYMGDALAGRPIFNSPSKEGGFRLRYGRPRNAGLASVGLNPATMILVGEFIAPATQLKTERPGKAAGAVPTDYIEGPTVRLNSGEMTRIDTVEKARDLKDNVEKIIDLGEIAVPFGEFIENNHPLAPASYTREWWIQEFDHNVQDNIDDDLTVEKAIEISKKHDVPLHPKYTYLWHDIEPDEYAALRYALNNATIDDNIVKLEYEIHQVLEKLLVPHTINNNNTTISNELYTLLDLCVLENPIDDDVLGQVNKSAPFTVRPRAMTRIGARMGRPEKAEKREMSPLVNALYPIANLGGDERLLNKATKYEENPDYTIDGKVDEERTKKGKTTIELNHRICPECASKTYKARCTSCDVRTKEVPHCPICGNTDKNAEHGDECSNCGNTFKLTERQTINIKQEYNNALNNINERKNTVGDVKAVKRLTSDSKIPEPLEKGLLRAKNDVSVFRDGTARYDMCDLPLTSFKPKEIGIDVKTVKQLGYEKDINGNEIQSDDQLIEMKMQDVVVAEEAGEYLLQTANYIDELLTEYYDMEPYYNANTKDDLVGTLMIGMAPHTSAGVVGRLIGFTEASANYAHPFFHAAKRRNCFEPNTELTVQINGEWNKITIKNLVETYLDPESEGYDDSYDDGTIVQEIENHPEIDEIKVPSMTDEGHRTIENITHLSKHKAPDHMVTIKTENNDEPLTVTPDHTIPVKSDKDSELIEEKKAHQIEKGDELFDYNEEKIEQVKDYKEIDILEHLLRQPDEHDVDIENVMIRGMKKEEVYELLTEEIKPKWNDGRFYKMKSSCEYLGITKKSLDNYLRRQSIPVTLFLDLYNGDKNKLLNKVPSDVNLGMNSDNTSVPRIQTLDEELACLIGYYTAEGFTRQRKDKRVGGDHNGSNHTDFAATEKETRQYIEQTLEKRFNKEDCYTNNSRITASGNLTRFFFSTVLDAGRLAHTKRVPEQIKESPNEVVGAYLSGYISGDGTRKTNAIYMYTVSEELKDELQSIIHNLGYTTSCKGVDPVMLKDAFPEFYDNDDDSTSRKGWRIMLKDCEEFIKEFGVQLSRKQGDVQVQYDLNTVESVDYEENTAEHFYNLTVPFVNRLNVNRQLSNQCDGDEDSVMLLMDGLINFSRKYLPSQRGKNMMDAPIVMSTVIDPEEIDDEAHNVDIVGKYPLELYKRSMYAEDPDDIDITIAEDSLEDPSGFDHTIETSDINLGPKNTSYKSVSGMEDATEKQMDLAEKTRAINEKRVAGNVVEKHFFPDIIGNLTAFSKQDFQCGNYHMHRRVPTCGQCIESPHNDTCNEDVRLTVYKGMVDKYLEQAKDLSEKYGLDTYTKQRLEALEDRIESVFEDDKSEQTSFEDFL